jgi:hypothetical protein
MVTTVGLPNSLLKVLLACGILAALLLGCTDFITGLLKPGYRFDSQSISVLSTFGTSTRPSVFPFNVTGEILLIAFAMGVWFSAGQNRVLHVNAGLLAITRSLQSSLVYSSHGTLMKP